MLVGLEVHFRNIENGIKISDLTEKYFLFAENLQRNFCK